MYEIRRLVCGSNRLEVAVDFVHSILPEYVIQQLVELVQSVWIVRQAEVVFAAQQPNN